MSEVTAIDKFDFLAYERINETFMIKKGIPSYSGLVYFKIKYKIEKTVTTNSKSFSFLLKVFVYARYSKYTMSGKVIKTTSKSIVSNIFILITDIILQNLCVEVCRKLKKWLFFGQKKL